MDFGNDGQDAPSVVDEQSLLQQFSCMGTTDKDELVKQLQKVIGRNIHTAAFFLEMNNWNLQAAICSYFDVDNPNKLPSMGIVSNSVAENENIEPNNTFEKCWNVWNSGSEAWPPGCYVQCAAGDPFGTEKQIIPIVQPGEFIFVTLQMKSPTIPGTYQSKWRFCTPSGSYFGDILWVILTVVEEGTRDLTNQLSHFSDLGTSVPRTNTVANPFSPPRESIQNGPSTDVDSNMC